MSSTTSTDRTANAVRRTFLEFFEERGHRFVTSSPVVPQDDPTLLFTNAGMNQFKDVFLGTGRREYTRAVNSQKCIRASGKHNDLEDVGLDTYHHTFFEMLGNWSFGDYFKRDAIRWAWQLLTEVWGLQPERLWVTVFGGDTEDGLAADEEAERIWIEETSIDPSRVLRFGRRDNFWEMGDTGPCGPCSEIHFDRGGPGVDPRDGADRAIGVNAGNERFMELWNLVFMQFNRKDDRSLAPLPACHVDTGMGFERILAVLQGKLSNYDTDLFAPLFARIGACTGRAYGESREVDIAFRVIADHLRAVSSAIADGALPSNEGRGYVLRRLLRRAARFGRQTLGMREPFLWKVSPAVGEALGEAFPEIRERAEHLELVIRSEEESFGKTLDRGLARFVEFAANLTGGTKMTVTLGYAEKVDVLDGRKAFELYATYGFPRDLVEQMLRERNCVLDVEGWEAAEAEHKDASRSEGKFQQLLSAEQLAALRATVSTYHAAPPDDLRLATSVLGVFPDASGATGATGASGAPRAKIVLAESPFYAESGGQVGDTGRLLGADGELLASVRDTRKVGDVVVHLAELAPGAVERLAPGAEVVAEVDAERRAATRANHTATHLLHKALREVLGTHVTQQGSYVGPDRLRFDFSHPRGLGEVELDQIEARVNRSIAENAAVGTTLEDLRAAKQRGVVALFGEKYDDRVRVVDVGGWSTELCGGTHVRAAGDIGPFVILSERALSAGVRRLEAVTRSGAVEVIQAQRRLLHSAARELKSAVEEVPARIAGLKEQVKAAKKDKQKGAAADLGSALAEVESALRETGGVRHAVVDLPELDAAGLRELSGRAAKLAPDLALAVFGREGERVPYLVLCEGAAQKAGLRAGELAQSLRPLLGGGGGGKPDRAQGQGESSARLGEARAALEQAIGAALGRG